MSCSNHVLRVLASRLGRRCASEDLETILVPMIRCALRTGVGAAPLVEWVSHHLPGPAGVAPVKDLDVTAPLMARQLSRDLRRFHQLRPALETIVA